MSEPTQGQPMADSDQQETREWMEALSAVIDKEGPERAHYLLGRTVDSGRVWNVAATARHLQSLHPDVPVHVAGAGGAAVLAVYAALLEPDIDAVILRQLPSTHMAADAPALLNVLRLCDIPEAVGLLAPRPVLLSETSSECAGRIRAIYEVAGAADRVSRGE